MKVAIIDTTIDSEIIGGAQTFLPLLVAGLIARGDDVHLITKDVPNFKVLPQLKESNVTLHTGLWSVSGFVEETAPSLAKWINRLQPDIFLVSVSADIGWVVLPLLNPAIATLTIGHTDSETFYLPARHYQTFLTRAVGVSTEVCQNYVSSCGIDENKVVWIPYGVRTSENEPFENDNKVLRLIYVGRLEEEQKRVSDLIKIAKALNENNIRYSLKIVGDGESMPKLNQDLEREIAKKQVQLLGWLNNDELMLHLRESDVFVLASAYEGFCIALIEAMANGCCPVVTDINSGNKQLITNGENGFIVPIGGIDDFVEKLGFLSLNRAALLEMRRKAWVVGANYSIERMVEAYRECFLQAAQAAQTQPRVPNADFPLMKSCQSKYPMWLRRIKFKTKQYLPVG